MTKPKDGDQMVFTARLSKIIRVATIAPLMALLLLTLVFVLRPAVFHGWPDYLAAVFLLVIVPVLGYPLQPLLPRYRGGGRDAQRRLAIVMAVGGYIGGLLYALLAQVSQTMWLIYLVYFFSGLGILLFSKLLKIKASGHACGVAGPVAMLVYLFGARALWGLLLLALVFWASIKLKRHNLRQLFLGSSIPTLLVVLLGLAVPG